MTLKVRRLIGLGMVLAAVGIGASLLFNRQEGEVGESKGVGFERKERSVVLITVDTTRADHLQPYGAENVATPNLQKLADRGILFERAISVAPITLVAHTSILSGLYPPSHGVRNNGIHYVSEEVTTLAETLSSEGYRTGAFVSAAVLEKRYGLDRGFEIYDDDLSSGRNRHERMVPDRPAEATIDSALSWVETLDPDDEFFLWIHLYDPHASYSPPAPFRDDYRERLYDGEIAYMDDQIGRLLRHPSLTAREDTIISVLGDHGESLGEHGEQTHALLAYDSTLRVPWILRIPGGPGGVRVKRDVSQVDFAPTLLDLLGLSIDSEVVEGRSLLPVLENPRQSTEAPLLYSETYLPYYTYGWAKVQALRRGTWKYLGGPNPELYDLRRDPRELSNQAELNPGVAHDFARDLEELFEDLGDSEALLTLDSEAAEKLRSLGYLSVGSGPMTGLSEDQRRDPKEMIDIHVGLERARVLQRDHLHEQAAELLRQALRRDPSNMAILIDLSQSLQELGEIEEAIEVAEKALELDPGYSRLHLLLSGLELARGNRSKALELVEVALGIDPRSLDAGMHKVQLLRGGAQFEELEALLSQLLEQHGDHPRLLVAWSQMIEMSSGELEAAEAGFRKAIERDPFLVQGWRFLGESLERQNDLQDAVAAYREGLERQPDDADLHARLGMLLARIGGENDTETHLREAIRLGQKMRPEVHVALGGWLAENRRFEDSQAEYTRVLELQPRHPGARNNQAVALFLSGQQEEAMKRLEELVEEFPNHADANSNLAAIAVGLKRWQLAETHARLAIQLNERNSDAWNNLGVSLEETGRVAEAGSAYERALAIRPDDWRAHFNVGILLRKTGRHADAAQSFRRVLDLSPQHFETHWELANLYLEPLADPQRARDHFNAFLRTAPGDPRGSEARRHIESIPPARP